MRRILPLLLSSLLLAGVAACSFPQTRWEKDGVTDQAVTADLVACRHAAQQEAFATSPLPYSSPFFGYRRWAYWEDNRFYAESRLTSFCMRSKGYDLVTMKPPQASPPPSPTPAPTTPDK